MITELREDFLRDLKKIGDRKTLERILGVVEEVESAISLVEVRNLKKLKGRPSHFRIRVGDYRIGLQLDSRTVVFKRCLPRKEVYRSFP